MRTSVLLCILLLLHPVGLFAGEIHDAVRNDDLNTIRSLVAADPAVLSERLEEEGKTALHVACYEGHLEAARLLIELGADVDAPKTNNSVPLHGAAYHNHPEIVALLLESGANIHAMNDGNYTAMNSAAAAGHWEIVRTLMEAGSDIHNVSLYAGSILHMAAAWGEEELVQELIDLGADVNAEMTNGNTPLYYAVDNDQFNCVQLLVENGGNIHHPLEHGTSLLNLAVRTSTPEIMEYLIEQGADIDDSSSAGWSLLHYAARDGDTTKVRILLDHDAPLRVFNQRGETPLYNALNYGRSGAAQLLLAAGARPDVRHPLTGYTGLHKASMNGFTEIVHALVDAGANLDYTDNMGYSALDYAGRYGHRDIAEFLQAQGAATTENFVARYGMSPLLEESLADGEATLWHLGHCGWGIKTRNNFLIFDYWNPGEDPNSPCLANGHILPEEIEDQTVTVFVTHEHRDHYNEIIFEWADELDNVTYVLGFNPAELPQYLETPYDGPDYIALAPHTESEINGMRVVTIEANDAGVGYYIEVDGVTLYHAGDHAGWADDEREGYFAEINYLDAFVDELDIAFVNVTGCHSHDLNRLREGNIYTVEHLQPRIFVPTHAHNREYIYDDCAEDFGEIFPEMQFVCPNVRGDVFQYKQHRIL